MNNLYIYDAGRSVPETAVKKISGGAYGAAGLSDINPQWRIEKLTEIFGACGVGWYFDPENIWINDGTMYAHVMLYHMTESGEWSKPVHGYGGTKLTGRDDDAVKSTITDAFGNACRYLGIGADVWMPKNGTPGKAQFDTKYSAPPVEPKTLRHVMLEGTAPDGDLMEGPDNYEKRVTKCETEKLTPPPAITRRTTFQVNEIKRLCNDTQYAILQEKHGKDLDALSFTVAQKFIKDLKAKNGGN